MKASLGKPFRWRVRYLMLIDLGCVLFALISSFVIRFEAPMDVWPYVRRYWTLFVLAPLIRLPVYYGFRLYRRLWRYASIKELKIIVVAGVVGSVLIFVVNFGLLPVLGITYCPSRSIWVLEGTLSTAFLGGTRFLLRLLRESMRANDVARLQAHVQTPRRILIAGAGDAGAMILSEMQHNPGLGLQAVGFVDDDRTKLAMRIRGVPVLGTREAIPALVSKYHVDEVIIAMPTVSGKEIRRFKSICDVAGVKSRTVPGMYELIGGTVSVSQIRDLKIEDLLRREPVSIDRAQVGALLRGKRVLVTGAGGSIGSELCRQIAQCRPENLVLLGHGENSLFHIGNELRRSFPELPMPLVVADIRDHPRLQAIFRRHRPEIVYHAAAHKHVPLMEANVEDAVTNNVLGTRNLVELAASSGVTHFVLISTDKAVNPTSVLGASKRLAELIVQDVARRTGNCFVGVRFGNVLGSRGSVVPLFQEQIALGGPLTITHPKMRRYFMTIPEAVQLVLQAAALGEGGEVFVLDMGEPVKIMDLARDLVALSGLELGRDIDIEFVGLRPGEKLLEELFCDDEEYARTQHDKIFFCDNGLRRGATLLDEQWQAHLEDLIAVAQAGDVGKTLSLLQELVPEYAPTQAWHRDKPSDQLKAIREA
ncbi:MAG TPA: nucleoside-diphosphate sugar epimerase/dehydratase [Anaerolineae bacterium]|nr:nucleoside-diphosphate sugar epimerase/dehydratase [Anaerolineae bacterium]